MAAVGLSRPRPQKGLGQGSVWPRAEAVGQSGGRAGGETLDPAEEGRQTLRKSTEPGAAGGWCGGAGVRRSPPGSKSRMGTLTFHEAVLRPQTEYHSFPQIHYLFPLMGILALSFLTL